MIFCAEDLDLEYISIDATSIRAHQCAVGYGKRKSKDLDAAKV